MPTISERGMQMPESPIRKLVPLANAAKARGVKFGRVPILKPDNYEEIHAMWSDRTISGREAARRLGISQFTFCKWTKDEKSC